MSTITFSFTVNKANAGPPSRYCGYFSGCPAPALPVVHVPVEVLRRVSARCCVTPPFIPISRFFVLPGMRFIFPTIMATFRR